MSPSKHNVGLEEAMFLCSSNIDIFQRPYLRIQLLDCGRATHSRDPASASSASRLMFDRFAHNHDCFLLMACAGYELNVSEATYITA